MIRVVVAMLILAVAAPAAAAPVRHKAVTPTTVPATTVKRDWLAVVVATLEGGFRMGNPAAPVKLIEYGSLTCPHCKAFEDEGGDQLRTEYIAKGLVSYEYRSFVLNSADYAVAVLARCDGAGTFFPRMRRFYATQDEWTKPFYALDRDRLMELQTLPPPRQITETARAMGLDKRLTSEGWDAAHIGKCLADQSLIDRLAIMRAGAQDQGLTGTPGFIINGKVQTAPFMGTEQQIVLWSDVEPRLAQALRASGAVGKVGR